LRISSAIWKKGAELKEGILQGAAQIATPALVSTLCICIVFLPMFFLSGVAKYLFVPLAEAVVFAMLASYILSRTLVPTLAMYLLKAKERGKGKPGFFTRFQRGFEKTFDRLRLSYQLFLTTVVHRRIIFIPAFLGVCLLMFLLVPWLGQNFFPASDNGQFILHMRVKSGTRIEESARVADLVEASIRRQIPAQEVDSILDNIGLPYSTINYMHSTSGLIGAGDADILVSLKEKHHPTANYVRELRRTLPRDFPGTTFYFLPADMVTQVLNFGLPAPIDIQIDGNDIEGNRQVAEKMLADLRRVPGLTDLRIQQPFDYPTYDISVDRTKAAQGGLSERNVASSILNSLSGSFQITPMFFLNWKNGVSYNLVTQTPQYRVESLQDLENTPITAPSTSRPGILADVASIERGTEMEAVSHYNIRRIVEIYGAVQDRDLGSAGRDINRIVDANRKSLPRGSFVTLRGQIQTMRNSYVGLLGGLVFSIVLVYLLIVVNFQSWLDPFIIITALPAALAGIVLFPVCHAHHTQRACVDGRDHVHGGCDVEQHSGDHFRRGTPDAPRRSDPSGD
jgi:multidrug efflux pump subunit AcrB